MFAEKNNSLLDNIATDFNEFLSSDNYKKRCRENLITCLRVTATAAGGKHLSPSLVCPSSNTNIFTWNFTEVDGLEIEFVNGESAGLDFNTSVENCQKMSCYNSVIIATENQLDRYMPHGQFGVSFGTKLVINKEKKDCINLKAIFL